MESRSIDMQCWKCGIELKKVLLPFSRNEECSSCNADLHVCISCQHYDPKISDSCHEDQADFVLDKDKANFCEHFKVNTKAHIEKDDAESLLAKAKLAALFGEEVEVTEPESKETGKEEADTDNSPQSEADRALAELNRLFGDDEK